ncbi:hypothetical protein ACFYNO_36155 [Kitasatospora sp. NPDC006697]|uniref:hypothetical protein n=1 Tax=Kitasatospora sp. NPDC006697 TaxID=3364020 RepID=UPI0036BF03AB
MIVAGTRRLEDSFPAIDFFEHRGAPFVVAVDELDRADRCSPSEGTEALGVDAGVPVQLWDACRWNSAARILPVLVGHALDTAASHPVFQGVPQ